MAIVKKHSSRAALGLGFLVLVGGAGLLGGRAVGDEGGSPMGDMGPEVMARITPGPQHAKMAKWLGKWDVEMRVVMPGAPASAPTKGTCTYEWLLEGRWMLSRMAGTMMGMPMEWVHVHGYNNMTKNYETIGFDNMSTDAKISYGNPVTPDGKTYGFHGFMCEWLNGQIHKPFRTVMREQSDDLHTLEVWDPEIGPNGAKVIEFTYRRPE